MDDARPLFAADAAQVVDVMEQGVYERSAGMSRRRMNDHSRRLVDDDDIWILIKDGQRQRFRLRDGIRRFGNVDGDGDPGFHRLIRLCRPAADADMAVLDQPLDLRTRSIAEDRCQESIEPDTIAFGWNDCLNFQRFPAGSSPRAESPKPRAQSREPKDESRKPKAESREQKAESRQGLIMRLFVPASAPALPR